MHITHRDKQYSDMTLVDHLKSCGLLREQAFVDGSWVVSSTNKTQIVTNPSDGSILGTVPVFSEAEVTEAIDAADAGFREWSKTLPHERAKRLRLWAELMRAECEDLAILITLEQGKPLAEALGEIEYAASFFDWFAGEAERLAPRGVTSHLPERTMEIERTPVGVAALITPWNFPSAMITRKAGAAIAAGCSVVVKPASETPFSALALAALAEHAGLPKGVFNVITGDAPTLAKVLCGDTRVRALSFTGSTTVGRTLLEWCAPSIKKVSLELGGHAPFIVFDDADMDAAVAAAVDAKFQTTGQDCLAANRILVHDSVYDTFVERFAERTRALRVGDGMDSDIELGPLMNERAVEKCEAHISDALDKGARILAGGERHALGGTFFTPTVLADVTPDMAIAREETFGPVAALMKFRNEAGVLQEANATEYGLAAYIFTNDGARQARMARGLDFGMVAVNCVKMTGGPIPFGGTKQSGLGREGGFEGISAFTETKYICTHIPSI